MTEEQAREILGDEVGKDGSIYAYYGWRSPGDQAFSMTDGNLSLEKLEAIVFFMRRAVQP